MDADVSDPLPCQLAFLTSRAALQDRYGPSRAYRCPAGKAAAVISGDGDDWALLGEVCRECGKNAAGREGWSSKKARNLPIW